RTAGQVAAFLGLVPRIQQSGQWKGRSRLSKQGPANVRAKLYMAAVVCLRYNPDIQAQCQRLMENGKSKMQALGAGMRKLVQICFGVVKHQSEYRPQVVS
ncbi:Transposase IS116/IS110/IS902 family protein, partial [Oleiphilus messinensis]